MRLQAECKDVKISTAYDTIDAQVAYFSFITIDEEMQPQLMENDWMLDLWVEGLVE